MILKKVKEVIAILAGIATIISVIIGEVLPSLCFKQKLSVHFQPTTIFLI